MTSFARRERAALCDLASVLDPDSPTLSGEWTVHDLLAHLTVRETDPLGAPGILLSPLAGLTDRAMRRAKQRGYFDLIERVRRPPAWSPSRVPAFEAFVNPVELFVHHEDIRRARDSWTPRQLDRRDEDLLWGAMSKMGRALVRQVDVPLAIERSDTGARADLKGSGGVTVHGLPSELALYLFGRQDVAQVELAGTDAQITALAQAKFGF